MITVTLEIPPHTLTEALPGLALYSQADGLLTVTVQTDRMPGGAVPGADKGLEIPGTPVLISSELIEQLSDWSAPVQVRVRRDASGRYELESRTIQTDLSSELPGDRS